MSFSYDIPTLIELVESRPILWDKTSTEYKDRTKKRNKWNEVFLYLEKNYEEKSAKEQQEIGDVIIGKWQNIRDAFIRSLKKKSGQRYTKNYIYSEQLKFLLKIAQKDNTESSINEEESTEDINVDDNVLEEVINNRSPLSKRNKQKEERKNKRHAEDDLDREIIKALKTCDTPKTPPDEDSDQCFFDTILPPVQNMSEDEKYEFHITVLKLVHDIKKKRNNFNNTLFPNQPRVPQYYASSTPVNFQQNVTPEYTSMSNTSETQQSCSSFFANYDLNE